LDLARLFTDTFCDRQATIGFLGLWDTVKSVFRFELRGPGPEFTSVVLPRTFVNPAVKAVRHAVAIDERRRFYRTNLWSETPEARATTDVKQVWFAGVHSDVGSGYLESESGLALFPMRWMLREARQAGLLIDPDREQAILAPLQGAADTLHPSLGGWWWLPEVVPKVPTRTHPEDHRPAIYLPLGERRFIAQGALVHESVKHRMQAGIGYAPPDLPAQYCIVS
jgi:hypothetical protein